MSRVLRRLPVGIAQSPKGSAILLPPSRTVIASSIQRAPIRSFISASIVSVSAARYNRATTTQAGSNRTLSSETDARRRQRASEAEETTKKEPLDEEVQEDRVREHQVKRPWLREDADKPPVTDEPQQQQEKPMTKGKLLTTPTRLLKLILPLPIKVEKDKDNNGRAYGRAISPNDDIQPLALVLHPTQPLSYLERLIQAELPPVLENGKEKIPSIYFRAENTASDDEAAKKGEEEEEEEDKRPKNVASFSGLGHEATDKIAEKNKKWVRWSSSTEMGDFIRDAARGREFAIEVEGYGIEMRVGVPSFRDRTYYMRLRLRKMSRRIESLADIKRECDHLAHRSAHRIAKGGFGVLVMWWVAVYWGTFMTDYGWDLLEPVTYLAGLAMIMGGYLWSLWRSRDISYRAAMNLTVSRRQQALYDAKGFDSQAWEQLVREANMLRAEIRAVANEYDVDWDEKKDLGSEDVKKVLEKERKKRSKSDDDEEEDDDAEEEEKEETRREDKKLEKEEESTKSNKE